MAKAAEIEAMRRAVALAARGRRSASPRPVVGCVILGAGGEVAGEGFFERGGEPHAEVNALRQAGERARGGTAVVTLEPCNHHGRTPPCSQALVAAGVARVVYAVADPNPLAAGGARALRAAGVEVEGGVLEAEATIVNEAWLTAMRRGRPFVTWKYAASLDGRIAAADGSSRWITGPEARADAHRLRAESDAILVGSGTQRSDDPQLTVRGVDAPRAPLRVIADSGARTPAGARVLDQAAPTLLAVADDADAGHLDGRAEILRLPRGEQGVDLDALLAALHQREVRSVLLEGGARLAGSFLAAGLIDRLVGYVAPVLLGGGGLPALTGPGAPTIAAAWRWRLDEVDRVGADLRLVARPLR
ncbi:MAG TPA: bifunctional diaminohydroxyphosphoribosylaminopyrimidine deaminase/5-amino-6-(5-phosphoribosylamino)uracil reductase RibD [Actinomycetes bacterium]